LIINIGTAVVAMVKPIFGDGNCLFRAVADQWEGNDSLHQKYRQVCCDALLQQAHDDPVNFAAVASNDLSSLNLTAVEYVKRMEQDGIWGAMYELSVLSQVLDTIIVLHRLNEPVMAFRPNVDCGVSRSVRELHSIPSHKIPMIHVGFVDGSHYVSIREIGDNSVNQIPIPLTYNFLPNTNTNTQSQSR
jgi:OTU domain-containing protein 3